MYTLFNIRPTEKRLPQILGKTHRRGVPPVHAHHRGGVLDARVGELGREREQEDAREAEGGEGAAPGAGEALREAEHLVVAGAAEVREEVDGDARGVVEEHEVPREPVALLSASCPKGLDTIERVCACVPSES